MEKVLEEMPRRCGCRRSRMHDARRPARLRETGREDDRDRRLPTGQQKARLAPQRPPHQQRGPGGQTLTMPPTLRKLGLPNSVFDRSDIIGMDPRGVGRSTPVTCGWELTDRPSNSHLRTEHGGRRGRGEACGSRREEVRGLPYRRPPPAHHHGEHRPRPGPGPRSPGRAQGLLLRHLVRLLPRFRLGDHVPQEHGPCLPGQLDRPRGLERLVRTYLPPGLRGPLPRLRGVRGRAEREVRAGGPRRRSKRSSSPSPRSSTRSRTWTDSRARRPVR